MSAATHGKATCSHYTSHTAATWLDVERGAGSLLHPHTALLLKHCVDTCLCRLGPFTKGYSLVWMKRAVFLCGWKIEQCMLPLQQGGGDWLQPRTKQALCWVPGSAQQEWCCTLCRLYVHTHVPVVCCLSSACSSPPPSSGGYLLQSRTNQALAGLLAAHSRSSAAVAAAGFTVRNNKWYVA